VDTEHLRQFVTLANTQHFGRASEICCVSPSTLSRTIKQIEHELQTCLFERDNRSVELTKDGKAFLHYARDSLQQWETMRYSLLSSNKELHGQISLYCSVTASYSFMYEIMAAFRLKHPSIEIKLHTGDSADAVHRVQSGQEDIGIAPKPDNLPAGISFKRFTLSPLVFICGKDSDFKPNKKKALSPEDWQQLPIILSEKGLARQRIDEWFRQEKITPNVYAQVGGNEAIVSMVSLGFGVGLVPQIVIDNSPLQNKVELFSYQPEVTEFEVGACVLEKRLKNPIIDAFWSQIKAQ